MSESLSIAIIEDETAHFRLMQRAILKEFPNADLHHFPEAGSCLKTLIEITPDVIITDYLTPGMNGIEFLRALNERETAVPVIMITGQGNEAIAVTAMKLGAKDYLVKTGSFFTLLPSVIARVTRERKLAESLRESEKRRRHLASRLLTAQEDERRRISLEIHDDLAQNLAVLKLRFSLLADRLRKDQGALKSEANAALNLIDRVIEDTRRISRDLNPSIIHGLKLGGAIKWMLKDFEKLTHIPTSLDLVDVDTLFCEDDQIIIYRFFQEALSNIRKHAEAPHVSVAVLRDGDHVVIRISDDGRGFDMAEILNRHVAQRGLGLAALDERARMLDGTLDISTQKGNGVRITMTIPVQACSTPTETEAIKEALLPISRIP
ncbi:MAG: response regulator [Pseudomonadota bacterium]